MEYLSSRRPLFPKKERLSAEKEIQQLFSKGNSFFIFPYKVFYQRYNTKGEFVNYPRVLVSVSKKNFRRAVDRNLLKRRTRESYRTIKYILGSKENNTINLAFLYLHKEILTSLEIEKKIKAILTKLSDILKTDSKPI